MSMCTACYRGITILFIVLLSEARALSQLSAAFTATPVSGCSPIVVQFTDQSTGSPLQWKWDLGNGVISFLQNPSTTYFNAGTYNVKLVVRNSSGTDSIVQTKLITVYPNPIVDFAASGTSGCFPFPVQFSDLSVTQTGSIVNHSWDFGDGDTSSLSNPLHTYISAGNFSVTLRVTNSYGCTRTFSKTKYIEIKGGVTADFTNANPPKCIAPVTVNFNNTSAGPGSLTYAWSFGDGINSDVIDPVHTYSVPGSYSVTLVTTSSEGCSDTLEKVNLITIGTIASQFSIPDAVCQNQEYNFVNTTSPPPANSSWDFGDGTTSTEISPVKKYTSAGTYIIKLVNHFSGCTDSISRPISVKEGLLPDFTSDNTQSCKTPYVVQFSNLTQGDNTYLWDFGDGASSADINPNHTYADTGSYTVTLIATSTNGCSDTLVKADYIQIGRPVININDLPRMGCVPLAISPSSTIAVSEPVTNYLWDFGDGATSNAKNPTHTYSTPGTYTVKLIITTASGCTDTLVMPEAVRVGSKPGASFTVNPNDVCAFQPIQFTDNSTGNVDQWLWQFGDGGTSTSQNPSYQYQDTGYFSVTLIVWSNTCPDTIRLDNIVHIRPPIAAFAFNRDCGNKFRIDFRNTSLGATTWSWDFGDGTTSTEQNPSHVYGATGNYEVTLSVSNGTCSNRTTQAVQVINERASFVPDAPTKCNGTTINFTAVNVDATSIASWLWDFGDGHISTSSLTASHGYDVPGIYTVSLIITDVLGCSDTSKLDITVFGPKAQFFSSVSVVCLYNNAPILFTDSSVTDGTHSLVKRIWNYGDGIVDSTTPAPYNHLYKTEGSYDVTLTVVDNYGCRDSMVKPAAVDISDPVADFYSPDTASCINKPVRFINTSAGNDLQYLWSFGDSLRSVDKDPIHPYEKTGSYIVSLLATDQYGCKDSVSKNTYISISVPSAMFSVSDSFSTCPPLLVKFSNSSSNYQSVKWDFGDGNSSTLANPSHYYTLPGIYFPKLTVSGPDGCVDSMERRINVRGPKGSFSYEPLIGCNPFTVKFTATTLDRISFTWDFSDGTTIATNDSVVSHTYTAAGDYVPKIILRDMTGCTVPIVGPDTIRVRDAFAKFSLSQSMFCDSVSVNFYDSTISNDPITSWQWNFGDGGSSRDQNPVYQYRSPGTYDIKLVVTTETGCKDSVVLNDSVKVFKGPLIDIIGDTAACVSSQLDIDARVISGDTDLLKWQWNFGNGNSFDRKDPPPQTYTSAGPYLITSFVTDEHGCPDSATRTINIHPLPTTDAKPDATICFGNSIQLNATGANSYLWNAPTGLNCTDCDNPIASPAGNTVYTVTGTNEYGCTSKDSVSVKVQQRLPLQVNPGDTICLGESAQLSASGSHRYSWQPSTGLNDPNSASPRASPTTSTRYTVTATDSANCFFDTASVFIKVFPIPTVDAGPDQTIEVGSTGAQLHATGSRDVSSWKWTPSLGLSCIDCPDPDAAPKQTTEYTIEVRNDGQCLAKDYLTVYVVCNRGNLFIPNTFSPNGDGMNDKFYPRGKGIFMIKSLRVFNRWGELVFERLNFNPNAASAGWDGTYKGKQLSPDVFVYVCEIVCDNNQLLSFKGDVTLLQ
ncbi:MAG TPA: PKD domain-containing protein [Chitinophagaceae bacterium]|nr:PKD domain-containing protein [Chitinophagaceae bacterium]